MLLLLPALLALQSEGSIDALHQARDLWMDLQPEKRATAMWEHCARCTPTERKQVLRLCVQTCSATELLSSVARATKDGRDASGRGAAARATEDRTAFAATATGAPVR